MNNYPLERGLRKDSESFQNKKCFYMVDTTISKKLGGLGLGRDLKYALTLLAQGQGVQEVNGRNRDQMASSMLNINLSLGGVERFYMEEDYPDFENHRDVIYYSAPMRLVVKVVLTNVEPLTVRNFKTDG